MKQLIITLTLDVEEYDGSSAEDIAGAIVDALSHTEIQDEIFAGSGVQIRLGRGSYSAAAFRP